MDSEVLAAVTLASCAGKIRDVPALVFPAEKAACRPADVSLAVADGFLVQDTINKHTDVIPAVDATDRDLMRALADEASLHANELGVALLVHDVALNAMCPLSVGTNLIATED